MIECAGLTLNYFDKSKTIAACANVSFEVRDNEFVGILGPSGSGKSSLLYLLSGLKEPTRGDVKLDGAPFPPPGSAERSSLRLKSFGFVFQQPFLIGYLSALENVMIVAGNSHKDHAAHLLEQLGLQDKMHRRPSELSGGEKQRVSVARALVAKPRAVFADEPTAALDHATGLQVVEMLAKYRHGALLMVTHDRTMLQGANRIFQMEEGHLRETSE